MKNNIKQSVNFCSDCCFWKITNVLNQFEVRSVQEKRFWNGLNRYREAFKYTWNLSKKIIRFIIYLRMREKLVKNPSTKSTVFFTFEANEKKCTQGGFRENNIMEHVTMNSCPWNQRSLNYWNICNQRNNFQFWKNEFENCFHTRTKRKRWQQQKTLILGLPS